MNIEMRFLLLIVLSATVLLVVDACGVTNKKAEVAGHYSYGHGWNYDIPEGHIDVKETGTMDFHEDGSALDSARQVYEVTLSDGITLTIVFNYISPSSWRLEGEDFYFAGVEESFRMEVLETSGTGGPEVRIAEQLGEMSDKIIESVTKGISRETKFHMDKLTKKELVWSYTYADGHTDTWEFYR